jgi:hypothetical protein
LGGGIGGGIAGDGFVGGVSNYQFLVQYLVAYRLTLANQKGLPKVRRGKINNFRKFAYPPFRE